MSMLSLLVLSIAAYFILKRKEDYESEIERISQLLETAENERQSDVSIAQLKKNRFARFIFHQCHKDQEKQDEEDDIRVLIPTEAKLP